MTTRRIDSHTKGIVAAICTLALLLIPAIQATAESDGPPIAISKLERTTTVDFESEILPIFRGSCLACHNRKRAKADLILETPGDIRKGSENGDVVNPGHGADSSLLQVAAHQVKPLMPPKDNKVSAPDLTPAQLGLLRLWIDQGAKGEVRGIGPIRWQPPAATVQPIDAVAVSPDGRWAAAGRANRIHIYDLPTTRSATALVDLSLGAPSEKFAHRDIVQSLAFSPDGRLLASGAYGEIKLWRRAGPTSKSAAVAPATAPTSAPTTAPVRVPAALLAHGAPATALAARPDGKAFVCVGDDRIARLWDLEKGAAIAEIKCSALAAREVAKRERTMQLAAAEVAYYKSVVEKAQTNQKASEDRLAKSTAAKSAAEKVIAEKQAVLAKAAAGKSSADSALAADAELQRADELAQAAERIANEAQDLTANAKAASVAAPLLEALAASADTAKKAAATVRAAATAIAAQPRLKPLTDQIAAAEKAREAADAEVQGALRASATAATEFKLAENAVRKGTEELAAAKAGQAAAQAAHKKSETDFAAAQQAMKSADMSIRAAAFSADNQFLASAADDGFIHLWSANTGVLLESIASPSARSIAFTKDGDLIAVNVDGAATRWNLGNSWTLVRTLGSGDSNSALTDRVNALQFSPDGTLLASGGGEPSRGGQIKLWDPKSGQLLRSFDDVHSDAVLALDFSPDGKQLASGAADRFVRVLDLKSSKVTRSLEGHTHHVLGVSWKPDGRTLASSGADNQVKIWDVAAADRKAAVAGFGKEVSAVHFYGTQGEAIAVAGDGQIKIVNEAGGTVRALQTLGDFLQAAATTADGRTLIVGGQSGVLTVWRQLTDPPAMSFPVPTDRP